MKYLDIAKRVIIGESKALLKLADNLPNDFNNIIDHIINLKGRIILTGIGKSGYIARKIAATFASTGSAAFYIHPAEASHGDLGMITENDLVIMLSKSGETKELSDIISYCKRFAIKMACITMQPNSTLASNSDFLLLLPNFPEASKIDAPTTSSLAMLALGDAITTSVQEIKGFNKEDFHKFHPGGKLGINLLKVKDIMHSGERLPLVYTDTPLTDTIITMTQKSLGCALVVTKDHHLAGIITDGDLRRHIKEQISKKTAGNTMSINPITISPDTLALESLYIMNNKSIFILPILKDSILIGVIHIHDLIKIGVG